MLARSEQVNIFHIIALPIVGKDACKSTILYAASGNVNGNSTEFIRFFPNFFCRVQLTLEQCTFELHESAYMQIFFQLAHAVQTCILQVSAGSWESKYKGRLESYEDFQQLGWSAPRPPRHSRVDCTTAFREGSLEVCQNNVSTFLSFPLAQQLSFWEYKARTGDRHSGLHKYLVLSVMAEHPHVHF